jgi:exopolysaccharide biosynthesis protein
MRKLLFIFLIVLTCSITGLVVYSQPKNTPAGNLQWEKIAPGLEFVKQDYGKWFQKGSLYALKISAPRKLRILVDKDKSTTLKALENRYKSLVTINGSYFQENFLPSGLLKINNKVITKLNKLGGSGVLAINKNKVNIFHKDQFNSFKDKFTELMQNGPLLVENNGKMGIYADDHEYSARTAIGLTKDNKILIVVADMDASPSLWEFASILVKGEDKGGFNCQTALNLDGGSSTGIRVNLPRKKVIVEEANFIANGLGVF